MGAWGVTMRQSDCGFELLDTIVEKQLKKVNFTSFNVSNAITLLNQFIQDEIERYRQKPPSEITRYYINVTLVRDLTRAALLVAECLADYYRTGELIVTEYVGEDCKPVDHCIKEFAVTEADFKILLDELQSVQDPEHWMYQGWVDEKTLQQWLEHIRADQKILEEHT